MQSVETGQDLRLSVMPELFFVNHALQIRRVMDMDRLGVWKKTQKHPTRCKANTISTRVRALQIAHFPRLPSRLLCPGEALE